MGAATAAVSSALAGCKGTPSGSEGDTTETREAPSDTARDTTETRTEEQGKPFGVGVYLGDEAALEPWERWFGQTVDYYSFNVPRDNWDAYLVENMPFERPIREIAADRNIVITLKMFPPSQTTMEAVAAGEHSEDHRRIARNLIDHGMAGATIRIGHELNGRWSADGAVGRADQFIAAWRQTAAAMQSVDDAELEFVWAPHIGRVHMDATTAYPGDDWVDLIGLTVYDKGDLYYPSQCDSSCVRTRRERMWRRLVEQEYGLNYWAEFARNHEKSLVFPEYGVVSRNRNDGVGGGDNPLFINRFAQWMTERSDLIGWHNVWTWVAGPHFIGPSELHASEKYQEHPNASEAFRTQFSEL